MNQGNDAKANAKKQAATTLGLFSSSSSQSASQVVTQLCVFGADKAGMAGVDREQVNRLIHEASKDSAFFRNQQRKDASVQARIAALKQRICERLQQSWGPEDEAQVNQRIADILAMETTVAGSSSDGGGGGGGETFVHVDMDMFYAAVEIRDQPHLADLPVAVGNPSSVVATSNYVARRFGVRAAMPGFIARRLCPDLVFVPSHREKYREAAEQTRAIFREYDPHFRAQSLDEARLNVTAYLRRRHHSSSSSNSGGGGEEVAREIRRRIFEATGGLTASAGISSNAILAKIASDHRKPNNQFSVPREREATLEFVNPLSIRKVPGIGRVMEKQLNALGIQVCGDLYTHRYTLAQAFEEHTCNWLFRVGLGLLSSKRQQQKSGEEEEAEAEAAEEEEEEEAEEEKDESNTTVAPRKSLSVAQTFSCVPTIRLEELTLKCIDLCLKLTGDIHRAGVEGRCVTVSLKLANFHDLSRSVTLDGYVGGGDALINVAVQILQRELRNLQSMTDEDFQQHGGNKKNKKRQQRDVAMNAVSSASFECSGEEVLGVAHRQIRLIGIRIGQLRPLAAAAGNNSSSNNIKMPNSWQAAAAVEFDQRASALRKRRGNGSLADGLDGGGEQQPPTTITGIPRRRQRTTITSYFAPAK